MKEKKTRRKEKEVQKKKWKNGSDVFQFYIYIVIEKTIFLYKQEIKKRYFVYAGLCFENKCQEKDGTHLFNIYTFII